MRSRRQIPRYIRLLVIAIFLLLGLQSCRSSIGWEWERTQRAGKTVVSDGLCIDSGGGCFCIRYFYCDEDIAAFRNIRSEEHTSELQSQSNLVCRLLLEKKKNRHLALPLPHSFSACVQCSISAHT